MYFSFNLKVELASVLGLVAKQVYRLKQLFWKKQRFLERYLDKKYVKKLLTKLPKQKLKKVESELFLRQLFNFRNVFVKCFIYWFEFLLSIHNSVMSEALDLLNWKEKEKTA